MKLYTIKLIYAAEYKKSFMDCKYMHYQWNFFIIKRCIVSVINILYNNKIIKNIYGNQLVNKLKSNIILHFLTLLVNLAYLL